MKITKILQNPDFTLLSKKVYQDEFTNFYSGDLLSWIMAHATSNDVLLTIINNLNVIAVASLIELPCIIFCDGVIPQKEMIDKADEETITIISTTLSKVEVIKNVKTYE